MRKRKLIELERMERTKMNRRNNAYSASCDNSSVINISRNNNKFGI